GPVNAAGPGVVYLLQYGSVDDNLAGPPPSNRGSRPGAKAKPKEELKLTRIEFEGRMFSNNKRTNRIAKFWDKVEVINAPCPSGNIDMPFNKDLPPERGMYLASEMLTVTTSPQSDGKTRETMYAEKNVLARTPDNFAHAAKVTFEEAKDQVIFEGKIGSPATFYKIPQRGVEGQGFK